MRKHAKVARFGGIRQSGTLHMPVGYFLTPEGNQERLERAGAKGRAVFVSANAIRRPGFVPFLADGRDAKKNG